MRRVLIGFALGVGVASAAFALGLAVRKRHERRADALRASLAAGGPAERFEPAMLDGLPEPARRYLLRSIAPGTPLASSVRLVMTGAIRLSRDAGALPMTSEELLAPPLGYVWKARVRQGPMPISGFDLYADGQGEMRWWLGGVVPIVRASGEGLARSAEGRLLGEAVFIPSALLPARGARWEAVDDATARVRLRARLEEVVVTLEVANDGSLLRVSFPRWNDDPRNGPVGYLPFVSQGFAEDRKFGGYTIPTRFEAGWRLGEPGAEPFFFAEIEEAEFR